MELLPSYFSIFYVVLLLTAFVKIVTTLSICRYGIGLSGVSIGLVILGVSFALALFVISPFIEKTGGLQSLLSVQTVDQADQILQPFIDKNTDPEIRDKFSAIYNDLKQDIPLEAQPDDAKIEPVKSPFIINIVSFLITELQEAFYLGFFILLPFFVIDILVTNILMLLSINQISHQVIALPCKILLFIAVDGWSMISEHLIKSYL